MSEQDPLLADFDRGVLLRKPDGSTLTLASPSGASPPHDAQALLTAAEARPDDTAYALSPAPKGEIAITVAVFDPGTQRGALGGVSGQALDSQTYCCRSAACTRDGAARRSRRPGDLRS